MLDLTSLKLFVRAVELGSLSRTADSHNLALAAVSRRITLLEAHYGVSLLNRTGRGVTATPAGAVLLERARDIFRQVELARSDLSDYARGLRGSVSICASTSAITQFLPKDLARFSGECPDIRLDLREAFTAVIASEIRNGKTQVGIVMAGPELVGLQTRLYRRDRLVVVAPECFRPGVTSARFADLISEDFVLMEDHTATTRLLVSIASEQSIVLRKRVQVGSFDAVCRMVQNGFGLGVLPADAAETLVRSMGLRIIDLEEAWAERQMLLCSSPTAKPSIAVTRFIDFLADAAQSR
jgi:DNA-binding transcriptional LysR family regulator